MDCPAGMGEAPWKVTGGSNDDGDWGHFRVWTIVEAEHVNGESREHKMVDSPGHWSSCSPYMQMQTWLCPNSRVLPADISMSSQVFPRSSTKNLLQGGASWKQHHDVW